MSGGSFDYAYTASDLEELLEKRGQWERLADSFEAIEADDVAAEIRAMLAYVDVVDRRTRAHLDRLRELARGMEWWHSCDWSRDQVDEEINKYRGGAS